jgi:hypothetical protein
MSEEACCGDEAAAPQRDRRVVRRSCIVVGDDGQYPLTLDLCDELYSLNPIHEHQH